MYYVYDIKSKVNVRNEFVQTRERRQQKYSLKDAGSQTDTCDNRRMFIMSGMSHKERLEGKKVSKPETLEQNTSKQRRETNKLNHKLKLSLISISFLLLL